MKLATKISAAISLMFTLVFGGAAVMLVLDELAFVEQEVDLHGRLLGRVVASVARETIADGGEREARELIREIDQHEERITIRWIELDTDEGRRASGLSEDVRTSLRRGDLVGKINPRDDDTLYTYVPLASNDDGMRVIQVAESLDARNAHVRLLLLRILGGAALGLLVSGFVAYVLGRCIVGRPTSELVEVARQVGEGDFSRRANDRRRDELGLLGHEMNAMAANLERAREAERDQEAERRQMEVQLQHADRLATLGQLASGVAHEIGTPLQSITIRSDVIHQTAGNVPGVSECVDKIKKQSGRVATIVRNLLRFARKQSPERTTRDLREVVENALTLVETAKTKKPIEFVPRLDSGSGRDARMARVDEEQIEQVLTNLILNGIQAMPEGGKVTVGQERVNKEPPADVEQDAGEYICLYVEDEGTGIPDDVLPHLFDPFFTTKGVDEGTGLGLSICYGIVREHGGWIDVKTSRGEGTRFSVYLPPSGPGGSTEGPP